MPVLTLQVSKQTLMGATLWALRYGGQQSDRRRARLNAGDE